MKFALYGRHKYHADYVGSCATIFITLPWLSVTKDRIKRLASGENQSG